MCTLTFASFLVSSNLVRKVGLTLKEFFIWGDDTEYSCRLARFIKLYQVGKSKTRHLKSGDSSQSICKEQDRDKVSHHCFYRNRFFIKLKYDDLISTNTIQFIFRSFINFFLSIRARRNFARMKCQTILYGLYSGIVFALSMPNKDSFDLMD